MNDKKVGLMLLHHILDGIEAAQQLIVNNNPTRPSLDAAENLDLVMENLMTAMHFIYPE